MGNLVFGLFDHSVYFSFHKAWRCSALTTSHPPSYNFRLSSYVLVSVLRSYLEYMRIFGGYFPVRASGSKPFFLAFCLSCCFCLSLSSLRSYFSVSRRTMVSHSSVALPTNISPSMASKSKG